MLCWSFVRAATTGGKVAQGAHCADAPSMTVVDHSKDSPRLSVSTPGLEVPTPPSSRPKELPTTPRPVTPRLRVTTPGHDLGSPSPLGLTWPSAAPPINRLPRLPYSPTSPRASRLPRPSSGTQPRLASSSRPEEAQGVPLPPQVRADLEAEYAAKQLDARHKEHSLADPSDEARIQIQRQLLWDRQVLHLSHRRAVHDPLLVDPADRSEQAAKAAWTALQGGMATDAKHKLLAYDGLVSMCNYYETRLHEQHETMRRIEHKCWLNAQIEQNVLDLEATVESKDEEIEQLHKDLKSGKPVEMADEQQEAVSEAVSRTLDSLNAEATAALEEDLSREEREAMAAMPGWSLEAWLDSLDLHKIVSESILSHIHKIQSPARKMGNTSGLELRFIQQLGKAGTSEVVKAMLIQSSVVTALAEVMYNGMNDLSAELDREQTVGGEASKAKGERGPSEKERQRQQKEKLASLTTASAQAEQKRQQATKELKEKNSALTEAAKAKALEMEELLQRSEREAAELRQALQNARDAGEPQEQIVELETKTKEAEVDVEKTLMATAQAVEAERASIEEAEKEEAAAAARDEEEREEESREMREHMQAMVRENENARQLSYAPPSLFFAGLGTVVGRCEAKAGDDDSLMKVVSQEHTDAVDSDLEFEAPNYLIKTTSRKEWWAVADPEKGLQELGCASYPKEQRPGAPRRKLRSPEDFMQKRDAMNKKLLKVGEPPLQLGGFVALRLYTGELLVQPSPAS